MKNTKTYVDFITEKLKKLLSIDSPTGYTKDAIAWLKAEYEAMGYEPVITTKGGLLVQLAKGCEGNSWNLIICAFYVEKNYILEYNKTI